MEISPCILPILHGPADERGNVVDPTKLRGERAHHVRMLTCPECAATNVDISANPRRPGEHRWRGRCLDCGAVWDFDDD
jgi:hypothetical protein